MIDLEGIMEFEWDDGNLDKSYKKHGITPRQSEEIFLDEGLKVVEDIGHAQKEERYIGIGKAFDDKLLFVVFTLRKNRIRVISARPANRKERKVYEEKTQKNSAV